MRWLAAVALLLVARPAAAATGEGSGWAPLLWQVVNLALLLGVVVYFGRKPVREYLAQRRESVQNNLESSARLLAEAEANLAQWKERADKLEAELAEIRDTSRRLAEDERAEILAQARATAERIRRDADAAVDQELHRARAELAAEASELAITLAARILRERVTDEDQQRLFDEFVDRVGTPSGGEG